MPNYWIFPITQRNLYVCLKEGIVGAKGKNARRVQNGFQIGDIIIFYVSRENLQSQHRIMEFHGIAKCVGSPFESNKELWPGFTGDTFPIRVLIEIINRKKCKIKPLIEKLSFINNKKYWGSSLLGGTRKISQDDFNLIKKSMK